MKRLQRRLKASGGAPRDGRSVPTAVADDPTVQTGGNIHPAALAGLKIAMGLHQQRQPDVGRQGRLTGLLDSSRLQPAELEAIYLEQMHDEGADR